MSMDLHQEFKLLREFIQAIRGELWNKHDAAWFWQQYAIEQEAWKWQRMDDLVKGAYENYKIKNGELP